MTYGKLPNLVAMLPAVGTLMGMRETHRQARRAALATSLFEQYLSRAQEIARAIGIPEDSDEVGQLLIQLIEADLS